MQRHLRILLQLLVLASWTATPVEAQGFSSGSTGVDGSFSPSSDVTLTVPPSGVFHFTTIAIPAGITVRFTRNAANTPVTLLASGDVTIEGVLELSGGDGMPGASGTRFVNDGGIGGVGGFAGGAGSNGLLGNVGGAGLGPGGGAGGGVPSFSSAGGGGGFGVAGEGASGGVTEGGPAYGTSTLLPAIGGSGGGGGGAPLGMSSGGGGGGGGAIVIASSGTITLTGVIRAKGGAGGEPAGGAAAGGGGSGGAIRLVANTLTGSDGTLDVNGGAAGQPGVGGGGGAGRIRLEADTNTLTVNLRGVIPSFGPASNVTVPNVPTLSITTVAGMAAPATPSASYGTPDIVLPATTVNPVSVTLAASNIPPGTILSVRVTPWVGAASSTTSTALSGSLDSSTATASVILPETQPSILSATATFLLIAADGSPVTVHGKVVERVRVTATLGGASHVAYLTRGAREFVPAGQ